VLPLNMVEALTREVVHELPAVFLSLEPVSANYLADFRWRQVNPYLAKDDVRESD
jgi:hypothetical protein